MNVLKALVHDATIGPLMGVHLEAILICAFQGLDSSYWMVSPFFKGLFLCCCALDSQYSRQYLNKGNSSYFLVILEVEHLKIRSSYNRKKMGDIYKRDTNTVSGNSSTSGERLGTNS